LTDGTWTYSYDNEGNVSQKSKGPSAETWTYSYDASNEITSAEDRSTPGGTVLVHVDYKYDALGRLAEKDTTQSGTTTVLRFGYDTDGNVWADLDGSNNLKVRRVFDGTDQPVASVTYSGLSATVAWYLTDRQGTVTDYMSNSGTLLDHRAFDAFGNIKSESNSANGDRYGYTGMMFDTTTGLQYNRARWYNPSAQRWMER